MYPILKSAIVLFLFFPYSSCIFSQTFEINKAKNPIISQIDSIVSQKMDQYNITGLSLGIIRDEAVFYAKGYGIADIDHIRAVNEHTVFHTASISKLFTAMAIMDLVAQDQIALDTKMIDLIPNLKYSDSRVKSITIKNLLNHTSGLPDIGNYHWRKNNQAEDSLSEYILNYKFKLKSTPNTTFAYSNLGYDILGYIIEVVTNSSFDEYMKENVLQKAEMHNSNFKYFAIPEALRASPHTLRQINKKVRKRKVYPYTREHSPSSTLNSSSADLNNWMISFLQALDKNESHYKSMTQASTDTSPYIGLGFQLSHIDGYKTIGHYGGDKGFRSYLVMIPEASIGLVLLANVDYNEDFRQEILHAVARLMLGIGGE